MSVKERGGTVRGKQKRGLESRATLLASAAAIFADKEYEGARLKDISEHAGISLGSLYFHFGNKDDVAKALLEHQRSRMDDVFAQVVEASDSPLERFFEARERIGRLMADDHIVQAGIRLRQSTSEELRALAYEPDETWARKTESMVQEAIDAGEISSEIDARAVAEVFNELFVGAQILAGMQKDWKSLPERLERQRPVIDHLLRLDA